MNALVQKEIRLIAPVTLTVLALVTVFPWLGGSESWCWQTASVALFFGLVLLALDSFGREFSAGTFLMLLSQPVERRRLWRTKTTILAAAIGIIFAVFCVSDGLRLSFLRDNYQWGISGVTLSRADWCGWLAGNVIIVLVAVSSALWTTLLIRQTAAAFWISFLAPVALAMLVNLVIPNSVSLTIANVCLAIVGLVYSAYGFRLAHRLFFTAQDVAWSGGVVDLERWRYFEDGRQGGAGMRHYRPLAALWKKEFQLHSISLFCAGSLLVLHVMVIVMRTFHGRFAPHSMLGTISEFFAMLWVIMPLVLGCMAVGEEHKLGVLPEQFCRPLSRRLQFWIKLLPVLVAGAVLGGVMPVLIEGLAPLLGGATPDFKPVNYAEAGPQLFLNLLAAGAAAGGFTLVAFFASTLARNFLQSLGIALVISISGALFTSFIVQLPDAWINIVFAVPTAVGVFLWLSYANFKHSQERGRFLWRNALGLTGGVLFILLASAVFYNRAWEVFQPVEPPHGESKLSLAQPPVMYCDLFDNLQIHLPDGRAWSGHVAYSLDDRKFTTIIRWVWSPFPLLQSPQFVPGSHWNCAVVRHLDEYVQGTKDGVQTNRHVVGYLETVGIQTDGTLWVSEKPAFPHRPPTTMTQFGTDTNWLAVQWSHPATSVLLLKNDGTLWRWGFTNLSWSAGPENVPPLRTIEPYQVGRDTDWHQISPGDTLAQKNDGSIWNVWFDPDKHQESAHLTTNWDGVNLAKLSVAWWGSQFSTSVNLDGSLWSYVDYRWNKPPTYKRVRQGQATNWLASAMGQEGHLFALNAEGTLWFGGGGRDWRGEIVNSPLVCLGIHHDWVGLASFHESLISLAADGSLWIWPNPEIYNDGLLRMKLPKQPKCLGNLFDSR